MAEHPAVNRAVAGSNPAVPAISEMSRKVIRRPREWVLTISPTRRLHSYVAVTTDTSAVESAMGSHPSKHVSTLTTYGVMRNSLLVCCENMFDVHETPYIKKSGENSYGLLIFTSSGA